MKRAGWVGLIAVVVAAAFWAMHDDEDRPLSKVTYRDGRSAVAPRRAAIRDIDPVAASADIPLRIEGRVIGPDGQPVAGATVVLEPAGGIAIIAGGTAAMAAGSTTIAGTATRARISTRAGSATSAADGRFAFTRLERRAYALFASTSALLAGPVRATAAEQPPPAIIRLAPGGSHIVTVVEEDGRPILDAQVHARGGQWTMTRTTDASGKAALLPLPRGWVSIAVEAPGHVPAASSLEVAPVAQSGETTIVLHSISDAGHGVSVSGRVVDERRAPIAEVRITVIGPYPGTLAPVLTNDRGEFTIPALIHGGYELQAIDEEHAPARFTPVKVAGVPIDGIEITMKDGGVVSGVVLDGDRKPAPFATLIAAQGGAPMREVITDAGGAFELRGMPRTPFWLHAESATAMSGVLWVKLSEKGQAEVELVLDTIGTITGTVVDERGAPLAGITVAASPDWKRTMPPRSGWLPRIDAITDDDGAFVLHGSADTPYLVEAHRRAVADVGASPRSTPVMAGDHDVRLRLVPEGRIIGRIVVPGLDRPLAAVQTHIWGVPSRAFVASDGSFQIAEVPPWTYDVSFGGPDFLPFVQTGVEVRSGETIDLGTLTAPRARMFVGRVVDSTGAPVEGARVEVGVIRLPPVEIDDPPAGFHAYRTSSSTADGTFRVFHMPPAPMVVVASTQTAGSSEPVLVPGLPDTPGDPPPMTLVILPPREAR